MFNGLKLILLRLIILDFKITKSLTNVNINNILKILVKEIKNTKKILIHFYHNFSYIFRWFLIEGK